jgi:hypothetical protein
MSYPMTGHASKVPHGAQDAVQLWACRAREPRIFRVHVHRNPRVICAQDKKCVFTYFGSFVLECVWNSQLQAVLSSLLFNLTYV